STTSTWVTSIGLMPMMDTAASTSTTLPPPISFTLVQAFLFRISTTLASTQCCITIPIPTVRAITRPIQGISTTSPLVRPLPCEEVSRQFDKAKLLLQSARVGGRNHLHLHL